MVKQVYEISADDLDMLRENNRLLREIQKKILGENVVSLNEAAERLDVSPAHLRSRLKEKIGFARQGKRLLFKVTDIDNYLNKSYAPAKG